MQIRFEYNFFFENLKVKYIEITFERSNRLTYKSRAFKALFKKLSISRLKLKFTSLSDLVNKNHKT